MEHKIYVFDDTGDKWEVGNITAMLEELFDDDLEMIYKSTRYFHELEMAKLELIELGFLEQVKGEEYDPKGVLIGAEAFANEIVKRMGEETLKILDSEVDTTWKQNKPDLSKYKKK